MRAVILAAGKGTRISRYLSGKPKCTVDIGKETLIEYTIKLLIKKGINDIAVIIGYNGNEIRKILSKYKIKFFENPFFDVTNSIASLWFAKSFFEGHDDYIIMNGDVFLEERLLDNILEVTCFPVMFADRSRKECADYKFFYEEGKLKKFGKNLAIEDTTGEYIGVAKLDATFLEEFLIHLTEMIFSQRHNEWWENVIYDFVGQKDIYICEISGFFWAEVDYIEDYERILQFRGFKVKYSLEIQDVY